MNVNLKCILFLCFLCIAQLGYAKKDYWPMLVEGRQWNLVDVYQEGKGSYHYRIDGTEVVEGKESFLVYSSGYSLDCVSRFSSGPFYFFENDGIISFMLEENCRNVIDFSIKVGSFLPNHVKVLSVDTIPIFGTPHRCIKFGIWNYWNEPLYWIEGIGSTWKGPFGEMFNSGSEVPGSFYGTRLLSVWDGDECIFDINEFLKSAAAITKIEVKNISNDFIASNELFDLQGRRLTSQPRKGIYIRDGRKVVVK